MEVSSTIGKVESIPKIKKRRQWGKRFWKYRTLYLLILPSVITVFIFNYIPIYGLQIAFKDFRSSSGIWGSQWVGLKHFTRFITYPDFWKILSNTLSISLYSLATFPLGVILALMLNEVKSAHYKKVVQMITYAPHFISVVIICSLLSLFLNKDNGVLNSIFKVFGGTSVNYLEKPSYFSSIYVWSGVWQNLGWDSIIYIAALANVPAELTEAAKIDGANRMKIITRINIPYILPTLVTMLILRTGHIVDLGFEKIYLLQNPLNLEASGVISTYVYEVGLQGGQFSYSTAIGLFNNVINIIMILMVNRISKRVTNIGLW